MYHIGILVRTGAHVCPTGSDSTGYEHVYHIIITQIASIHAVKCKKIDQYMYGCVDLI